MVEAGVFSEYQTYLRNKENESISYAHVDSVDVFRFIEFIYSKQRNNPIFSFEKGADIELWLRDQWAGIFQELLRQRKDNGKFADLASQIRQLEAVNSTLKSYLESVLQTVSPEKSGELIERENKAISHTQRVEKTKLNHWFDYLVSTSGRDYMDVFDINSSIISINDLIPAYRNLIKDDDRLFRVLNTLKESEEARQDFNEMRSGLGLRKIRFSEKFIDEISKFLYDIRSSESLG